MRTRTLAHTLLAAATGIFWIAPNAHAYIDGGTASMLFQMVVAGLLASSLFIRSWWANLKNFVARITGKATAEDSAPSEESAPVDE